MGMTDLQFKSHLRQIISRLESALKEETEEKKIKQIEELLNDLKEDMQG